MRISDWSSDVCSSDLLVFKDAHTFLAHFLFHEVAGAVIAFCHVLSPFIAGGPASRLCEDCPAPRSEEHTSELQSLMRISYAVFCLKTKIHTQNQTSHATDHKKKENNVMNRVRN